MFAITPTGATVNLTGGTTTGNVALGTQPSLGGMSVMVTNAGAVTAFIAFGGSAIEAVLTTGVPVLAGAQIVLSVGPAVTHMAAITPSSTAVVYITPGQGV